MAMSSTLKDARWVVALRRAEIQGINWGSLDYDTQSLLLAEAHLLVANLDPEILAIIAAGLE